MEYRLCPSILSADFNRLGTKYFIRNAGDQINPQRIQNVF